MNHIILYEPEIPQNTGNIIRLCANTGFVLHLIEPLGFIFNSSKMKRAGLDYHEFTNVKIHKNWEECSNNLKNRRIFALTTKGKILYDKPSFQDEDVFLFGPETRGLPSTILSKFSEECKLRLPMLPHSRSINLSNTVAVILFETWKQNGFTNGQ